MHTRFNIPMTWKLIWATLRTQKQLKQFYIHSNLVLSTGALYLEQPSKIVLYFNNKTKCYRWKKWSLEFFEGYRGQNLSLSFERKCSRNQQAIQTDQSLMFWTVRGSGNSEWKFVLFVFNYFLGWNDVK